MYTAVASIMMESVLPESESDMLRYLLRRWRLVLLIVLVSMAAIWAVSSYFVARHFVSRRSKPYVEKLPTEGKIAFTEQRLTSRDSEQIGSWFSVGTMDSPIVLLVHGHMGDRSQCLPYAQLFNEMGCGTMLITMRAHGDSTGTLNDFGYGGRLDVIAAVEFLQQQAPGRPILLLGISAGATAVSFAAAELGNQVAGVIMEEPFLNILTAVKRRTDLFLPPVARQLAYYGLVTMAPLVLPHYAAIAPVDAVTAIPQQVPVWILAGGRDDRANPEEAQAIFQSAASHAELTIFPEATHESLLVHDGPKYREMARKWVMQVRSSGR